VEATEPSGRDVEDIRPPNTRIRDAHIFCQLPGIRDQGAIVSAVWGTVLAPVTGKMAYVFRMHGCCTNADRNAPLVT